MSVPGPTPVLVSEDWFNHVNHYSDDVTKTRYGKVTPIMWSATITITLDDAVQAATLDDNWIQRKVDAYIPLIPELPAMNTDLYSTAIGPDLPWANVAEVSPDGNTYILLQYGGQAVELLLRDLLNDLLTGAVWYL